MRRRPNAIRCHWLALLVLAVAGCRSLGPRTVSGDRFNYNEAGAKSTSEQLLLNIIRLRYGEPTYWLEITAMLSQYEIKSGGGLSWFDYTLQPLNNPALRAVYGLDPDPALNQRQDVNVQFTDRPTITYVPLQGREFADRLMAPIPPATIIYLAESGWPIDRLLDCCVQRINGVSNLPVHDIKVSQNYDPAPFKRISTLLRALQDRGELRFGLEYDVVDKSIYLETPPESETNREVAFELRQLLGIEHRVPRLKLVNKPDRSKDDELAMQTRSLVAAMFALAGSFSPPEVHIETGEVLPGAPAEQNASAKWLDVRFSNLPVKDAFVQVHHNGQWFYIAQSDYISKRTFALLTYLLSLQTADMSGMGPMLTVPTGG